MTRTRFVGAKTGIEEVRMVKMLNCGGFVAARERESAERNYVFQKPKKSGFAQHSVAFKSCKQFKIVG